MTKLYRTTHPTPLGPAQIVGDERVLVGLHLTTHRPAPGRQPEADLIDDAGPLARVVVQLDEYFAGDRRAFDLDLDLRGSDLQRRIWSALCAVPFAATATYGGIARAVERPTAARAVGAACGRNPIWIVVPCHRVVGASGALTGYAGGLDAKRHLLDHEREVQAGSR
ncbi:MAG: methylated-DNA--[protein]-cysteine S-methyltransferase [Acidimicrobiales bacterium]